MGEWEWENAAWGREGSKGKILLVLQRASSYYTMYYNFLINSPKSYHVIYNQISHA